MTRPTPLVRSDLLYADLLPTPIPSRPWLLAVVDAAGTLVGLDMLPAEDGGEATLREALSRRAAERGRPFAWDAARTAAVARELTEYFAGARRGFTLAVDPQGTPFQRTVWAELARIPYGVTISYGELARRVGRPAAPRAVGAANGANPIPIVLPCHRVIGADGSLTGYGGGLPMKRALLALEGALPEETAPLAFE